MRVYLDSSALIKRVVREAESLALVDEIDDLHRQGALLVSATLAWTEVARVLRVAREASYQEIADDLRNAMLGVAEHPLDFEIMNLSRRVDPHRLRSLDAIHLAAAIALDADLLITYDDRLAAAALASGIPVASPA
ncbi:PIN domain-containing protein [Saccharopolyspora sp. TS4A08]|uniref:Ribonuclease VapC n=1 Tax=Saccharopolyspora ipomoeae TaxID=3042027 RepID=A0ABT6PPL9_9PSEU|nr:PIN domain-containing protein [Saccharopolyspora sp. TS4A08]MDI2029946.1 PIN domain-containing protein [Saccharopolyspora sp. TS4A08]